MGGPVLATEILQCDDIGVSSVVSLWYFYS